MRLFLIEEMQIYGWLSNFQTAQPFFNNFSARAMGSGFSFSINIFVH
jgi:hypothetical protein